LNPPGSRCNYWRLCDAKIKKRKRTSNAQIRFCQLVNIISLNILIIVAIEFIPVFCNSDEERGKAKRTIHKATGPYLGVAYISIHAARVPCRTMIQSDHPQPSQSKGENVLFWYARTPKSATQPGVPPSHYPKSIPLSGLLLK
jgi:hypothetical protein